MRAASEAFGQAAAHPTISTASSESRSERSAYMTTRDCPRVTVRFSRDDYQRLQELADGAALSVYLRAVALAQELPKRKHRSVASIKDKQAIAQVLGLLGQSRIANNLNQLAYHANIGSLVIDDDAKAQISEAYDYVVSMRKLLLKALGVRP